MCFLNRYFHAFWRPPTDFGGGRSCMLHSCPQHTLQDMTTFTSPPLKVNTSTRDNIEATPGVHHFATILPLVISFFHLSNVPQSPLQHKIQPGLTFGGSWGPARVAYCKPTIRHLGLSFGSNFLGLSSPEGNNSEFGNWSKCKQIPQICFSGTQGSFPCFSRGTSSDILSLLTLLPAVPLLPFSPLPAIFFWRNQPSSEHV